MSVGPREEKFNIASNDHGRMQKCHFSVCLKGKTHLICRFPPSSLGIRSKKYFTDYDTPNTVHGFGVSPLGCKMHDRYCRIPKNFEQHFIPSHQAEQAITMDRLDVNKPLQNAFKRIWHCIYLFKLYGISIILFLKKK